MHPHSSRCVRWQLRGSTSNAAYPPSVICIRSQHVRLHARAVGQRKPLPRRCLPAESDSISSIAPAPTSNLPVAPINTAEAVSHSSHLPLQTPPDIEDSNSTPQGATASTTESSAPSNGNSHPEPEYIMFTAADLQAANLQATSNSEEGDANASTSAIPADADAEQPAGHNQQQAEQPTPAAASPAEVDTDEQEDEEDFLPPLDLEGIDSSQQQQFIPPPLIDPNVDIANDPAYTIRLLDILDQISSSSSLNSAEVPTAPSAAASSSDQQQTDNRHSSTRQPAAFCVNCCTPLDPYRPLAPCSNCGHLPANDTLLLNLGVSSEADLEAYPAWQQQQEQQQSDSSTTTAAGASFVLDTKQLTERLEAGMALRQARQLLRDAGILNLPAALLAFEDDLVDPEPAMQLHRGLLPPNHERPERLKVILARLRTAGLLDVCDRLQPREATDDELLAVHSPGLIAAVSALSHANQPSDLNQVAAHMAPDVLGNRFTYRAARLAAGTAAEMARQLVQGNASCGMALIRPLGHQAGVSSTEGGNYFNSVAVAARAAQAAGARRVMIIDWDVHHCKGTSDIFAEDPNVLVFSLHRYGSGYYPGTGAAEHVGTGRGCGRNINVAWCPPSVMDKRGRRIQVEAPPVSDGDYLTAWHMLVLPVASEFKPDVILVSAGFDAVDKDPLGYYRVHPECFGHLTAMLKPLAPLGLLLEGGYNLAATAACVESCVRVLLGEQPAQLRGSRVAGVNGWSSILRTLLIHQQHWQSLSMLNFLQLATPAAAGDGEGEWEDESEDAGYEYVEEDEESEEYELQEEEFSEAAEAAGVGAASAGDSAATDVTDVYQDSQQLMQQVLKLLDKKSVAGWQQQQQQQLDEDVDKATQDVHIDAGVATSAVDDVSMETAAAAAAAGEAEDHGQPATATTSSSGSDSSSWSAGGFMDDTETVDSGTEDDDNNTTAWQNPGSRTDWGLEQYDEDVTEHMSWYDVQGAQRQLRKAEKTAAEVAAAAAAITGEAAAAESAERGMAGAVAAVREAAAEVELSGNLTSDVVTDVLPVVDYTVEAAAAGEVDRDATVVQASSSVGDASAETAAAAAAAAVPKASSTAAQEPTAMLSSISTASAAVDTGDASSNPSKSTSSTVSASEPAAAATAAISAATAAAATFAAVTAATDVVSHPLADDAGPVEAEAVDSDSSSSSSSDHDDES